VLSLLLSAKDEEGNGLTDQELRDELITLLFAGHETTATALTAAMYWLHRGDGDRDRAGDGALRTLRAELDGVDDSSAATSLVQLPYLTAVSQEALRIHPVAMLTFPRRVKEPVLCGGFLLSPGDIVLGSIYLLHQREDLYPNPRQFLPERFIDRQFTPYEFMPFGAGVRRCIGASLAQYELRIVLGTLLSHLDFSLVNSRPVGQARRGVTLGFDSPVRLRHQARRPATFPPASPLPQSLSPVA
jgi:cytochrome P450